MTDTSSATRRFLALWFPFLPTERLRIAARARGVEGWPERPLILVERAGNVMRLAALDRDVVPLDLTVGMNLADARAQEPDLLVIDADPFADAEWLERLAEGCDRFTPMVALDGSDTLLLDITGAAHLFGGEHALAAELEQRLARLGMSVRTAFGSSPEAAGALARHQTLPGANEQAALRRLPIAALRLDEEVETALKRAGLTSIGALADRPAAPLAARFGDALPTALARLLSRRARPLNPRRPQPMLVVERRFAEPIARTGFALDIVAELIGEAAETMAEAQRGGRRFQARFYRSDGLVLPLDVETSIPTRDPAVVMRLFRERIDSLSDPLDPGYGFDLLRLAVPVTEALAPSQLQLEGGSVSETQLTVLIDRLATRLGRGSVRRQRPHDTHIPEQASLALTIDAPEPQAQWPGTDSEDPPLRPLHILDPPERIEVMAEVPDGPPRRFQWKFSPHRVLTYEGPERIAPEWWRDDVKDARLRDYYRVEDEGGSRFWIFRNGLYGPDRSPDWYLHGVFA